MLNRIALAAVAATFAAGSAAAWPDKPITLIVPYKAGGTTHTKSMVLSKALGKALGGTVVVKTRPGAGSAVGVTFLSKAEPDGHTIAYTDLGNLIWNPLTKNDVAYKVEDLRLIAGVSEYQLALVTTPDKPYKTLDELLAYSKTNPLNVADMGGMSKTFINYMAAKEDVQWTAIPTRGGGEMVPFLLGGKIDFAFSGGVHQKHGDKMIVLASFLSDGLAKDPDAPTTQDLYGIAMPGNSVLITPAGVSDEIAAKLEAAVEAAMEDPDFTQVLQNIQFPKRYIPSSEISAFAASVTKSLEGVLASMK
ncbi:MAG: tripartite tricarboxylate transporter substrate binding protein [Alphaproteobacteria bacterium]|nr:tripartite tricarboxylate transporter substrate binding protein [Alphaproteobacteria bacterium]MCY4229581.1 tripartite tricarboxylate transporter substrate binding protein [Alphaproteobacteria bacterium]MCY4320233.1 tripartite tricarboxylate transporter substrate binding protein [Alphaproteobacteria bacterium]